MPLSVHGILRTDAARELDTSGVSAAAAVSVRVVVHRDLTALITETDADEVLPSRANLLVHARLLDAAGGATVLPMRFGVVVPDEKTLRATFLEPQHDALVAHLDRLEGHVELRLRGLYEEQAVLREVLASDPGARRLRGRASFKARMELGERVTAGILARRDRDTSRAVEELGPHVADIAAADVAEPLDAFMISFLVHRASLASFDEAVDRLAESLAPLVHIELVGPLPPFSFAGGGT